MINILGIAGTFMAGIASLAKESGYAVTGCDANIYPPMSTLLDSLNIEVSRGYSVKHLGDDQQQIVIGNALSRGNEMVEAILSRQLNYTSGPQWLAENILSGRTTYAVAGTHGKTSTSSILTWLLESAGQQPGFLIGGKPGNFDCSARLGRSEAFVVEADEYDTAFFDKRSKFVHYRPQVAILNNLEFDHADIFEDIEAIKTQFHHLIRTIPSNGLLIVNADDPNLSATLNQGVWTAIAPFSITNPDAAWYAKSLNTDASDFVVRHNGELFCQVSWPCFGEHNMSNALAAIAAAHHAGASKEQISAALVDFKMPAKRLQAHLTSKGFTLYEDFAHHPTAIEKTLATLKKRHPQQRLVAILEPRSNTMRTTVHANTLPSAVAQADQVYYYQAEGLAWSLENKHQDVLSFSSIKQGLAQLQSNLQITDVVVVMSNGDFGGLVSQLTNMD